MFAISRVGITLSSILLLSACGDDSSIANTDNSSPTSIAATTLSHQNLASTSSSPPQLLASMSAAQLANTLNASSSGQQILKVAGNPVCGVDFNYIKYNTIGAANESTTASGALMTPTGGVGCTGQRPIVIYAHGTQTNRSYNIADATNISNPAASESMFIATMFAAQGYTVIAPNYAGYDSSTLSYHPYLNYKQQSQEMIDALNAGRAGLPQVSSGLISDSGKLYVTGISEGGYVAMAALKAMTTAHIPVTAAAPISGPYALEAFGDAVFMGYSNHNSTTFIPLLTTGYQKAYGNIYQTPADIYTPNFSWTVETTTPNTNVLFQGASTGNAQLDALSPVDPAYAYGFASNNYLINTNYRLAYLADMGLHPDGVMSGNNTFPAIAPQNTMRQALKLNDLRGMTPTMPVLMCGGGRDSTVFFANTVLMSSTFATASAAGVPVTFAQLDIDAASIIPQTFTLTGLSAGMQSFLSSTATKYGVGQLGLLSSVGLSPSIAQDMATSALNLQTKFLNDISMMTPAALTANYHGVLVAGYCSAAAREFFKQY
ncbi:alpha/beta hydrolase family protein [Aquirhabdus sp.]|uniref:alpha/beta hydrolase family protein n=1 Tax=Aquirhabdus sp. TaxID=2824160 RepID=UPI00396C7E12